MPTRRLGPHDILYEDNHLLVVNKPCGLATMGVPNDETSLVELARHYLKLRYAKPGNVYLGVVSRLDRLVSGAIVLARTSKAAARLTRQFLENRVEKTYWALVAPPPPQPQGVLESWVNKNDARHRMEVVPPKSPGAKLARLSYGRRARLGTAAWLEVELETGRKHQIRLQLAELGCPILGDRKYGSSTPFPAGIALHARRLAFEHPVRRTLLEVTAPLPASWRQFARLNGSAPPWQDDPSG